jgi:trans-aconitate 2-methyltransferase
MWNPEDYAQHSDAQLKWARELRSRLNLRGDESLLDVGCGDGKITADFAKTIANGRVIGVDSSPEMVNYASQTYPTSQYPNLQFLCMDARSLVLAETFDVVFSNATLHWVPDHVAFLTGVAQILKPGGKLMISCGGQGNAAGILAAFAEVTQEQPWQGHFTTFESPYTFHGVEVYQSWLADVNLHVERLELVPKDMIHLGIEGLAGWIRTTWMPFIQCVPDNQQEQLIQEVVSTYLKHFPLDKEGFSHVEMVRLEVEATKETASVQ